MDFDPEKITYARLLEIFWESHIPTERPWSRQYMNAIFYHDEQQRRISEDSKKAVEEKIGRNVRTEVSPLRSFTAAEDYHQKYLLKRHSDLYGQVKRFYSKHSDFVDSTAAARLNGYVGGHGGFGQLSKEIDRLGLRENGKKALQGLVRK